MPNILESKNTLIVPLTLFIENNFKSAAEKFATIFGSNRDELLSTPEDRVNQEYFKKQHQQFNEKSMQKVFNSQFVADFNLGKKRKTEFISELLSLFKLPCKNSMDVEEAWNALIEFNLESSLVFDILIKLIYQGKSIYFIGDTNELHAKKILDLFSLFPFSNLSFLEDLPDPTIPALPFVINQVSQTELVGDERTPSVGSLYFCLSYAYKTLMAPSSSWNHFYRFRQPSGLLTHLKQYLNDVGKTKTDILLVHPYQKEDSIIQRLALETLSKENFYSSLHAISNPLHPFNLRVLR